MPAACATDTALRQHAVISPHAAHAAERTAMLQLPADFAGFRAA